MKKAIRLQSAVSGGVDVGFLLDDRKFEMDVDVREYYKHWITNI